MKINKFKEHYKEFSRSSDAIQLATILTFKRELALMILFSVVHSILGFAQPYATQLTLSYINQENAEPGLTTYAYMIIAFNVC